jgi:hypothetical protein
VPDEWQWGVTRRCIDGVWLNTAQVWTFAPRSTRDGQAATPALALTAACLRAKAAIERIRSGFSEPLL